MLADRVSRSRMIVISLVVWSLVTVWTGAASSTNELLLTRVLLGIAECAYLPAAIALIADHHAPETRATALGIHLCGLNLGLVAGGGLAGFLGETYGWRSSFLVLGAAGLGLAVIAWFLLKDAGQAASGGPKEANPPIRDALVRLARTPSYLLLVAQAMLIAVGVWMFFNWMPLYFKETFGMSLAAAGFSGTITLQLSASLGILLGGILSDRVARTGLRRRMLLMGGFYLLSAPCLLVFAAAAPFGVVTAGVVLFSFGRAMAASNEGAIVCDLLPPRYRSTSVGMMNTANCLAGGIGIFVAGFLKADFGLSGIFSGVSALVLVSSALSFLGFFVFFPRDLERRRREELSSAAGAP
jgi:predicted MFS family arabinose efflux permease